MSPLRLGVLLLMAGGGCLIAFDLQRRRSPLSRRVWAVVALFVMLLIGLQIVLPWRP